MEAVSAIELALADLPATERTEAGAVVVVALVFDDLEMDEDELNAAARRGLLLAAASGNPAESCVLGSRAVLETAADLSADGYGKMLVGALAMLAGSLPAECPCVASVVVALQSDHAAAAEALAVVVLHRAME